MVRSRSRGDGAVAARSTAMIPESTRTSAARGYARRRSAAMPLQATTCTPRSPTAATSARVSAPGESMYA